LSYETQEREFASMKWGLAPYWSKTGVSDPSSINARSDNLDISGPWREPWKRRRCLIPAQFFYEWEKITTEEKKTTRAESAKMCPAAGMSDWIFHQEKSNFPNAGSGIPMLILL